MGPNSVRMGSNIEWMAHNTIWKAPVMMPRQFSLPQQFILCRGPKSIQRPHKLRSKSNPPSQELGGVAPAANYGQCVNWQVLYFYFLQWCSEKQSGGVSLSNF